MKVPSPTNLAPVGETGKYFPWALWRPLLQLHQLNLALCPILLPPLPYMYYSQAYPSLNLHKEKLPLRLFPGNQPKTGARPKLYHKLPLQSKSVDFACWTPKRCYEMNHEVFKMSKFPERGQKIYPHAILRKVA